MFNLFLKIFLFLSPIALLPLSIFCIPSLQFYQFGFFGNSIDLSQKQLFCYLTILLFFTAIISNQQRIIKDRWLAILFIIFISSIYLHPKTTPSFPFILFGFMIYYFVSRYARIDDIKNLFKVIAFVSLLNTVFAILQTIGIHFLYFNKNEIIGMMSYKTQLGIYQAVAIPICYSLNPFFIIVPLVGLLLAKSITGIMVSIVGICYMFRKHILSIQSPPIYLCLFTVSSFFIYRNLHKIFIRTDSWIYAIKQGINHYWIGNGFGTFQYIKNTAYHAIEYKDPYSLYIQVFHATGAVGVLVFLLFLFKNIVGFRCEGRIEEALFASCLVFIVSGFCYSFMDYPRLAGTAIVLFSLLTAIKLEVSKC